MAGKSDIIQIVDDNDAKSRATGKSSGLAAAPLEPLLLREPIVLLWLSAFAIFFFLMTHFLVQASQRHRQDLAASWAKLGSSALASRDASAAVADYRNSLLYAPDDRQHRLKLAQALLAAGRSEEAQLYLQSLWEDEPANGKVNLELARLAVYHHDVAGALRFYHGAIYGLWDDETESHRREVRVELVEFLLREKFPTLAQSELIALEPDIVTDPLTEGRVAGLFARAGDEEGALRVYQKALRARAKDPEALAGAGEAAYQLGRHTLAQQYLQRAVEVAPNDARFRERLQLCSLLLKMDPYEPALTGSERAARAGEAFRQAGMLLTSCTVPAGDASASTPALEAARAKWTTLKPRLSDARMRREPEFLAQVMSVVAEVAASANNGCEAQEPTRKALLAISKEGEERK